MTSVDTLKQPLHAAYTPHTLTHTHTLSYHLSRFRPVFPDVPSHGEPDAAVIEELKRARCESLGPERESGCGKRK
jgi:hypothetical protein